MEPFGIALAIVILILWRLQSEKNNRLLEDHQTLREEFRKLRDRPEKLTAECVCPFLSRSRNVEIRV